MSRRVLVTGGGGFIGSNVVRGLLERGDEVRVLDNFSTGNRANLAPIRDDVEIVEGELRSYERVHAATRGVEVVFHQGALPSVPRSVQDPLTTSAVNVEGTLNTFRAAARAGAARFVYASSVAAYGFHRGNPVGITEDWPTRPADRLFYAQEKAELEQLLNEEAAAAPGLDVYLLRPPIVLGPNAVGGKLEVPAWLRSLSEWVPRRLPPVPIPVPDLPVQLIHEDDVASALLRCVLGLGPPGAYNIAADDTLTAADIVRLLGGIPVPLPARPAQAAARAAARMPGLPQPAQWIEALAHPAVMDTSKARTELGWEPKVSASSALLQTLRR